MLGETEGQKDRTDLSYWTLPATARGPKRHLVYKGFVLLICKFDVLMIQGFKNQVNTCEHAPTMHLTCAPKINSNVCFTKFL